MERRERAGTSCSRPRASTSGRGRVVRAATLHVYQAQLGERPRMVLRPLRDSGTSPCELDFNLDFVPGSIQVPRPGR